MDKMTPGGLIWDITPDLVGIADANGMFIHTNPAWFTTLGLTADDIQRTSFMEMIHPDDVAATEHAYDRLKAGHQIANFENRYRHADGHYVWLSWTAVPMGDKFFWSGRDISDGKAAASELEANKGEAALREQFIAVLGHDLRNPLAALGAGVNIIRRKNGAEGFEGVLDQMDASIGRMAELIENVMDFALARLGDGIAPHDKKWMILTPSLEQVVDELRLVHPDVEIITDFGFDEPIECEPSRISQLLSNLLSNAISHGDMSAPIKVNAYREEGHFVMTVSNEGEEIPQDARAMVFEPFRRADIRASQNGLGLGLFIAREIAKGHDGTLTFTSDDTATVFRFSMPATQ